MSKVGQELSSVPFGDMIAAMGLGIAQAQVELDKASTEVARLMSGARERDRVWFNGQRLSLIELGFTPTFYQFIDSIIEIKIVVNLAESSSSEVTSKTKSTNLNYGGYHWWNRGSGISVMTSTVDAKYSNTYDYSVEGSSLMRTKLVPVPPPAILEERIRIIMDEEEGIRYRNRLNTVMASSKDDILTNIRTWTWGTDAIFGSKNDLQIAFLNDTPSVATLVEEFPEIFIEPEINSAIEAKLESYLDDLKNELQSALSSWTPPAENFYNSLNDIRSDFLLQNPSLASKLAVNREFLEETPIFTVLSNKYTNYRTAIRDMLKDAIRDWVIPEDGVYNSHRDMMADFFLEKTELNALFIQHQDIVQSTEITNSMVARFDEYKDAIINKLEDLINNWKLPFTEDWNSQSDLAKYFYTQYPILQAQVAGNTNIQTNEDLREAFEKAFKVYHTIRRFLIWTPTAGQTFANITAVWNAFSSSLEIDLTGITNRIKALPEFIKRRTELLEQFRAN